jgi:hypothetical protein
MRVMFIKDFFVKVDDAKIMIEFGNEGELVDESTNEIYLDSGYTFTSNPRDFLVMDELIEDDDILTSSESIK